MACRWAPTPLQPLVPDAVREVRARALPLVEVVKDTRARDLLGTSQPEFSAAFKGSPMKRAKRRGLARNAAVVLGNTGTAEDIPVLEAALQHDEPLVREHAA